MLIIRRWLLVAMQWSSLMPEAEWEFLNGGRSWKSLPRISALNWN